VSYPSRKVFIERLFPDGQLSVSGTATERSADAKLETMARLVRGTTTARMVVKGGSMSEDTPFKTEEVGSVRLNVFKENEQCFSVWLDNEYYSKSGFCIASGRTIQEAVTEAQISLSNMAMTAARFLL
jgi:hypothetical protein